MPTALPAAANLADGAERRRLRRLAAGVRVDLGVEHQDVDVAPVGQHVIEAAVADVVGPAVAADEPDALLHQVVGERFEAACLGGVQSRPARPRSATTRSRWAAMPGLVRLVGVENRRRQAVAELRRDVLDEAARGRDVRVERQAEAEAELGVVLEQRVRPGRAAAVAVGRVGRRRQVAAVDRRAAGGVGDEQPVAEELGQQLQVRRLAAAGAGARVLEQRLEELRALVIELGQRRCDPARAGRGRSRSWRAPAPAAAPAGACRSPCASGWCGPWPGRR